MLAGFVAALAMVAGCSPLPGDTVDPMFLKFRDKQAAAPPLPAPAPATAPSAPATAAPAPASAGRPGTAPRTIGARVWSGRYRDSRGGGEVTFSLAQHASTVTGTWRLRTGGGGTLTGSMEGSGGRLRLRMTNTAPECPGTLEGWAEIGESSLRGAYHGSDCEGVVSDGWLELHPR